MVGAGACALWPAVGRAAATGCVKGTVKAWKKRGGSKGLRSINDASDVIVYLEGVPGPYPRTTNRVHEIRQINKQFVPRVSAVVKNTPLSFPNDDKIYHNVYSNSPALRFDLGFYRAGTVRMPPRPPKEPGIIEVRCNVHHHMEATILVLDNPYFAKADKHGNFEICGVPEGVYPIVTWTPGGEKGTGVAIIEAGKTFQMILSVIKPRPPGGTNRRDKHDNPRKDYK